MNGELQIIGIIVQSGSVGISLALVWYVNEIGKRHHQERENTNIILENHLSSSTKAIKENTKTNLKTVKVLQKISDKLQNLQPSTVVNVKTPSV